MTKRKGLSTVWLDAMNKEEILKPPKPVATVIWLDDIRDPVKYGYPDAIWIKNAQDFSQYLLSALDERIFIEEIHFDNDLGEESQGEGYDCFLAVENLLHNGELKSLRKIYVHSSNPSAVHKFMLAARGLKYHFGIDVIRNQY